MEKAIETLAGSVLAPESLDVRRNGTPVADDPLRGCHAPIRVDGKFFARARDRLRVRGVTYGPFAPDDKGYPFPGPDRVSKDFARMRALGINAVRTYHVPP